MDVEHIHFRLLYGLKWLALAVIAVIFLLFIIAIGVISTSTAAVNNQAQSDGVVQLVCLLFTFLISIGGLGFAVMAWGHFRRALLDEFKDEEAADNSVTAPPQPDVPA